MAATCAAKENFKKINRKTNEQDTPTEQADSQTRRSKGEHCAKILSSSPARDTGGEAVNAVDCSAKAGTEHGE